MQTLLAWQLANLSVPARPYPHLGAVRDASLRFSDGLCGALLAPCNGTQVEAVCSPSITAQPGPPQGAEGIIAPCTRIWVSDVPRQAATIAGPRIVLFQTQAQSHVQLEGA